MSSNEREGDLRCLLQVLILISIKVVSIKSHYFIAAIISQLTVSVIFSSVISELTIGQGIYPTSIMILFSLLVRKEEQSSMSLMTSGVVFCPAGTGGE